MSQVSVMGELFLSWRLRIQVRGGLEWRGDDLIFRHVEFEGADGTPRKRCLTLRNTEINGKVLGLGEKT